MGPDGAGLSCPGSNVVADVSIGNGAVHSSVTLSHTAGYLRLRASWDNTIYFVSSGRKSDGPSSSLAEEVPFQSLMFCASLAAPRQQCLRKTNCARRSKSSTPSHVIHRARCGPRAFRPGGAAEPQAPRYPMARGGSCLTCRWKLYRAIVRSWAGGSSASVRLQAAEQQPSARM